MLCYEKFWNHELNPLHWPLQSELRFILKVSFTFFFFFFWSVDLSWYEMDTYIWTNTAIKIHCWSICVFVDILICKKWARTNLDSFLELKLFLNLNLLIKFMIMYVGWDIRKNEIYVGVVLQKANASFRKHSVKNV